MVVSLTMRMMLSLLWLFIPITNFFLLQVLCSLAFCILASLKDVRRTSQVIVMVAMSWVMAEIPVTMSKTCPSNCSNLSPVPYPFGAKPGCGSPGFQLADCSKPLAFWNLTIASTPHPYYIKSIGSNPNHTDPYPRRVPNYGFGGSVVLFLNYTIPSSPSCASRPTRLANLTTTNLYAFEDAELTFYQDHYFLLNCTTPENSLPDSGVLTPSSPFCTKYVSFCNLSRNTNCLDYVPDKELQLLAILRAYNCSSLRRYIVSDLKTPILTWISGVQFAWGPVQHADSCRVCQSSDGECGYDVHDRSNFQCYCADGTYAVSCREAKGKQVGVAVGIGVSITFLFILVAGGLVCYLRFKKTFFTLLSREHINLDTISEGTLKLPYGSLAVATKFFSTLIGQGAFSKVYRGVLPNGREIAVKVLDGRISHSDEQFLNEVATIGNIHHINVARLVGFCVHKSKRILVYEFISNGSLDKFLLPKKQLSTGVVLSWKQRYGIALGVARGLYYMHEECRSCIIHCDIKPQNILLDTAFCPKIADFGLARLLTREESRVLTQARGTPGYVAPEFWSLGSGPLTPKFDVYSYGVVLLEIIQGQRCSGMLDMELGDDDKKAWFSGFIDKRIEDEADIEQAKMCLQVAQWCIQDNPALRPSMGRVVEYLEGTTPVPENLPKQSKRID